MNLEEIDMGEFKLMNKYIRLLKKCDQIKRVIVIINICYQDSKSMVQNTSTLIEEND